MVPRVTEDRRIRGGKIAVRTRHAGLQRIDATTKKLVELILAWALAVDEGTLAADEDPGVPVLEMFEAGYTVHYSHDGIELRYATGWKIAPVPVREDVG